MMTTLTAQINRFYYKAVIYNNGTAVSGQSLTLPFTCFQGAGEICQEIFITTYCHKGEGTIVSSSLADVDISNTVYYKKAVVNLGTGYTDIST